MIAVTYTVELLEPLLATSLDGDPNTKASHEFIPGSMIRGALIYLYLQAKRHQSFAPDTEPQDFLLKHGNETEHRLFLSDQTRYLNAYPLLYPPDDATMSSSEEQPYRLLPVPKALQIRKKARLELNGTKAAMVTAIEYEREAVQLTGVGKSFCLSTLECLYLHSPDRQLAIHTARERKQGRATEADGAVFQYDALSPGQTFGGHILVSTGDDADLLMNLLNQSGELWLGGSRSAGYGHVQVTAYRDDQWQNEVAPFPQTLSADEVEAQKRRRQSGDEDEEYQNLATMPQQDLQAGEYFAVTCLSHCLVRDEIGQPTMDIRYALATVLQVPVSKLHLDLLHTQRTMTLVGGFNRMWGLPLPQLPAIVAGSVFTLTADHAISAKTIQTMVEEGIGELRMDGLGRIAVNWLPKVSYDVKPLTVIKDPGDEPAIQTANQPFARQIGERILRRELDANLVDAVAKLPLHKDSLNSISKSQLSRLRTLLREQLGWWQQQPLANLSEAEKETLAVICFNPIIAYFAQLKRPAQKQWQAAKVGQSQTRFALWLQQCVDKCLGPEKQGWPDNFVLPQVVKLGALSVTVPTIWRVEYTLRLIDGVLAQAAKQIKPGNPNTDTADREPIDEEVLA